jgi:uroporphyrinogen-III decarboxylase
LGSVERVRTTLQHEEPDKVPKFDFLYNELTLRKFVGDRKLTPARTMDVWLSLGFDLAAIGFNAPKGYRAKRLSPGIYVDEWGTKSRSGKGMSWYLDGTIKGRADLDALENPDPQAEGRTRTLEWALRSRADRIACASTVSGAFTQAWMMTGFHTFARALYADPRFVRELLSRVNDFSVEMGKIALDMGAEFIWISDDLGGSRGPMISPPHFNALVLPCLKKMVREFKRRGAFVLLHCDGNVMPIIEGIVDTGLDAFHPTERKAGMDLAVMKNRFGEDLTLIGNLEASHLIPEGRPEDIDEQMRECFRIGAPGGGYVFASDHSMHPAISAERARFVFSRAEHYRNYGQGH